MPHVNTPQARCRAGVARVDITPPVGIYHRMWGAATHDRSTGVHRPLTATALALEPLAAVSGSTEEIIVVAVDHCLLWSREMDALLARVSQSTGVARERLLIAFSHTHAAGLMGLERVNLPGGEMIPAYLDTLSERIGTAVAEARAARTPATITLGPGNCSLARHRDFWDAMTLQFVCGFNPQGPSDDTVLVGAITADDGRTLATLVNYACHPTTLAWDNTLISPDYIGAMREVVESSSGAPCVFLQGASGDLGPRDGYVGDVEVADRNGRMLGHAVLAALEALPPPLTRHEYVGPVVSGATIGVWKHAPLGAEATERLNFWHVKRFTVELPFREDLITREKAEAEIALQTAAETEAQRRGDDSQARDCRAQIERMTRWLVRLATLPAGSTCHFPVVLARLGDVYWVMLESEHYQRLQTTLRQRFADATIIVATVVNGSFHTYLPNRESYGLGIYQETVAVLAPGCLETLTDAIGDEIQRWRQSNS